MGKGLLSNPESGRILFFLSLTGFLLFSLGATAHAASNATPSQTTPQIPIGPIIATAVSCNSSVSSLQGSCSAIVSVPVRTSAPFAQYGYGGSFYQSSSPIQSVPVTPNVLSSNLQSVPYLITCPYDPSTVNAFSYINPGTTPLIGGDECMANSSPLISLANLKAQVSWSPNSVASANVTLNVTNIADLNVQNLAYSGEAYNGKTGIGSANISNGYDSYSNIFSGVPPSSQHGIWTWSADVANLSNPAIPEQLRVSAQFPTSIPNVTFTSLTFNSGSCEYSYNYTISATVSQLNNTQIPVPLPPSASSVALANSWLKFDNQTYTQITEWGVTNPYDANIIGMADCYLPDFTSGWHLLGSDGILANSGSAPHPDTCVYQYQDLPQYWAVYTYSVTQDNYFLVSAQANAIASFGTTYELPAFYYNSTIPAAYSSLSQTYSYYNQSYYLYSYHNLQSPSTYLDPVPLDGQPGVFINANGNLTKLSSSSFYGGSDYSANSPPPGLNNQGDDFVIGENAVVANTVYGLTNAQDIGNYAITSISNPMFLSESNNDNLFVVANSPMNAQYTCGLNVCTGNEIDYYLYDIQYVPQGNYNASITPISDIANYTATSPETYQQYASNIESYWTEMSTIQLGSSYIVKAYNLTEIGNVLAGSGQSSWFQSYSTATNYPSPPVAFASDYAGDLYVIASNQISTPNRQCPESTPGTGFHLLYISSNGVVLGANVTSGPQALNTQISGSCAQTDYTYTYTPPVQPSVAVSPGGEYMYVSVQTLPYVYIYKISISNNTLNATYISPINLSYSNKEYNLSIVKYLEDGGPFNSESLANFASTYLATDCNGYPVYYNDSPNTLYDYHMPLGLAVSSSALYVLDNWNFGPYDNRGCPESEDYATMLMLRAFYLNGTEIPIHGSSIVDVIPNSDLSLTTGYQANVLYPPYGWPLSANFTTYPITPYSYISYCTYLCTDTPYLPVGEVNSVYGGYPPIGPTVAASGGSTNPSPPYPPYTVSSPISMTADFNSTLYIDVMAIWENACSSKGDCNSACQTTYTESGEGPVVVPQYICDAYRELLSLNVNIDNYTKLSNGSTSGYSCYGAPSQSTCGYLNNNYSLNSGLSPNPSSYTCYIGENPDLSVAAQSGSPCTMVPNVFNSAPPPFIGMPNPFAYVESLGSADNYVSLPNLASAYTGGIGYSPAPAASPNSSGISLHTTRFMSFAAVQQDPPLAPTITFSPSSSVILGQTVNITAQCYGTDECAVEYPNGTVRASSVSPADTVTYTINTMDSPLPGKTGKFTFYAVDLTSNPNLFTSAYLTIGSPIQNTTATNLTKVVAQAQNATIGLSTPPGFVIPTYLKTKIAGYLLVPYNYTYTLTQTYTMPMLVTEARPLQQLPVESEPDPPSTFTTTSAAFSTSKSNQVTLPAGYNSYIWALAGITPLSTNTPTIAYSTFTPASKAEEQTWSEKVSGTEYLAMNSSAVGNALTGSISYSYDTPPTAEGVVGLASTLGPANVESFASTGAQGSSGVTLDFDVLHVGDTAYIAGSGSASLSGGTVSLPAGCEMADQLSEGGNYNVWVANCIFSTTGTFSASFLGTGDSQSVSLAAWVFSTPISSTTTTSSTTTAASTSTSTTTIPTSCPPLPSNFPSSSSVTYEVYAAEPVYADSVLNETVQGGEIIPQYQNWLKYYIANLSDQYLISPPQVYLNIFANRIFGEIYINQTISPGGFAALDLDNGYYTPSGLVINSTHNLNYTEVNFTQNYAIGGVQYSTPGYSVEEAVAPGLNPLTVHRNPESALNASWTVSYTKDTTLLGDVWAYSININQGVTLTTNGFSLIAVNTITSEGTIDSGYVGNQGAYGANGADLPFSYGGSGGGSANESWSSSGGDTLVPGGAKGMNGAGTTPPANLNNTILSEFAYDAPDYLSGAGGASGGPGSIGGSGGYGLYMQANVIALGPASIIDLQGLSGDTDSGAGGSGVLILAYGNSLTNSGSYDVNGQIGGTSGGPGQVITYQYQGLGPIPLAQQYSATQPEGPCYLLCSPSFYYTNGTSTGSSTAVYVVNTSYLGKGSFTFYASDVSGFCQGSWTSQNLTVGPGGPQQFYGSSYTPPGCTSLAPIIQITPGPYSNVTLGTIVTIEAFCTAPDQCAIDTPELGDHVAVSELCYTRLFCGNSILLYSASTNPTLLQLFDQLKLSAYVDSLQLNLEYNPQILGYNRINYTYVDEFNNKINMPLDIDLANITTIKLTVDSTLNSSNPNETQVAVSGTAGYYPNIYAAAPSPVPANSPIYIYYDTDINFYNTSYAPPWPAWSYPPQQPSPSEVSYFQYGDICAFGASSAPCSYANPEFSTAPPVGQGSIGPTEANVITFATQYNSIGACSLEPNSLLLGVSANTNECNIYGSFGLPTYGISAQGNYEYCVPDFTNGSGVLTSQLGLIKVASTDSSGYFNDTFNVCGTGTARVEASYYGYPPGQPTVVLQPPLQTPSTQNIKLGPFQYPCTQPDLCGSGLITSNTPFLYTTEFNYTISPNSTYTSFPIGTYYLSFGSVPTILIVILLCGAVAYMLLRRTDK